MSVFFLVVISLLTLVWFYLWKTFIDLSLLPTWLSALALLLFVSSYFTQIYRILNLRASKENSVLMFMTYFFFGLMNQLFFLAILKDAVLIILFALNLELFEKIENLRVYNLSLLGIGLLANLWGVRAALQGPRIRKIKVVIDHLPVETPSFLIAQISDLHVGPIIKRSYVEKVGASMH